jgi:hypothetical protein
LAQSIDPTCCREKCPSLSAAAKSMGAPTHLPIAASSMVILRRRGFAMMGLRDEPVEQLFYAFRLESHVPSDHLLRGVDAVFDFGSEGAVPDHSTFSKNRHGCFRESDIFRDVFEEAVRTCVAAGLVRGEAFAIDTSVIEADASRVAVARKLITILNAILRDRRPWQPIPA